MTATMHLPDSPEAFADATWDDIRPYYEELANRPLSTENVEAWLADWSRLDEMVSEAMSLSEVAYTTDTENAAKEAAQVRFFSEIAPQMHEQTVRLSKRLVDLGYEAPALATLLRSMRNQIALFREENVPLVSEE